MKLVAILVDVINQTNHRQIQIEIRTIQLMLSQDKLMYVHKLVTWKLSTVERFPIVVTHFVKEKHIRNFIYFLQKSV